MARTGDTRGASEGGYRLVNVAIAIHAIGFRVDFPSIIVVANSAYVDGDVIVHTSPGALEWLSRYVQDGRGAFASGLK
jgi:hypothetical protein